MDDKLLGAMKPKDILDFIRLQVADRIKDEKEDPDLLQHNIPSLLQVLLPVLQLKLRRFKRDPAQSNGVKRGGLNSSCGHLQS